MGHLIEQIALSRHHRIVAVIDNDNIEAFESSEFRSADVAIEFSVPGAAVDNILKCFASGVPVVSGTTGWYDSLPTLKTMCEEGKGTLLAASNFSIGVNIFMALNRYLAGIMQEFPAYTPSITEIHHIHKLDHPSGTAITLAEQIIENDKGVNGWMEPEPGKEAGEGVIPVSHVRDGEVPGTHTVTWKSDADTISITHEAHSREGFALGAVRAAEWLAGRQGFFTIGEMLSDLTRTQGLFK